MAFARVHESSNDSQSLQNQLDALRIEIASLKSTNAEQRRKIVSLSNKLDEKDIRIDILRSTNAEQQSEINYLRGDLDDNNTEYVKTIITILKNNIGHRRRIRNRRTPFSTRRCRRFGGRGFGGGGNS